MKYIFTFLFLLSFSLSFFATHIIGGNFHVCQTGPNTFELTLSTDFINKIFSIGSEKDFQELVFKAFRMQIKNNPIYSKYCKEILKNKPPNNLREIPFLPIKFFKQNRISK